MIRCPLCNYRTAFMTQGFFGRKKVPKPEELAKILPDCRILRILVKVHHASNHSQHQFPSNFVKLLESDGLSTTSKLVMCKLCNNRCTNPRMLPYCQHSYCLTCIEKLYEKQNESATSFLSCPTCQNRIAFVSSKSSKCKGPPSPSVIGNLLPVDYALSTLISLF